MRAIPCGGCHAELQPSSYPIDGEAPEQRTLGWGVYTHLRVVHRVPAERAMTMAAERVRDSEQQP